MTTDSEQASEGKPSRRPSLRIALLTQGGNRDLVDGFPGRFLTHICRDGEELQALLDSSSVDLVLIDCRNHLPERELLEIVRGEPLADYLAVGRPGDRKSIPSWIKSHWCPWPVDSQSFYRLLVAMARKSAWERAFKIQNSEVRGLKGEAALGRKLAQVLHELNNPLDAVLRFVRMAQKKAGKAGQEHLDNALLGLERMETTLGELHCEARKTGTALNLVDLKEVLREAAIVSENTGDRVSLRTRIQGGPYRVPEALTPVVINLLLNARRACGSAGSIEIDVRKVGADLEIQFQDDGEGFEPLFKEEVFKPYFSTRGDGGGMGLGLSTARDAIERLGGHLDADSLGHGRGATFTLTIPMPGSDDSAQNPEENETLGDSS